MPAALLSVIVEFCKELAEAPIDVGENGHIVETLLDTFMVALRLPDVLFNPGREVGLAFSLPGVRENPQDFGMRLEVDQSGLKIALIVPPPGVERFLPPCTIGIRSAIVFFFIGSTLTFPVQQFDDPFVEL